jgi:RNA polymerase sigma-70 factor (ECF subfamily)
MRERDGSPGSLSEPKPAGVGRGELRRFFEQVAGGRLAALGPLYRACSEELYGLALWRTGSPADAADVVQEVFVRLARFRERLPAVRDPLAYLRRMARGVAVDLHRRRARTREQPFEECDLLEAVDESPDRQLEARRVSRLLFELPAVQREAIYLRHFAGCSFAEIGRATSVPTFTAASRYRLGMKRLRQKMGVQS